MKTAIYFCNCGTNISDRIGFAEISAELSRHPDVVSVTPVDFLCAEDGKNFLRADLAEKRPDRVVIAACTPREYQLTFMRVLEEAGINPYFLQIANIREQVAWVTPDRDEATAKACAQIRGAVARVGLHEPLKKTELAACTDVLVIGAGPAGLKSALTLAESGRKVVLIEKTPALGGLPVRFEELFPSLECAPCMLEPVLGEVMHGPQAANIEILTLAELVGLTGYYGNFTASIRRQPRYIDDAKCMGCQECIAPCPVSVPNEFSLGLDERKAIALPFLGALPNVPFLDDRACLRNKGEDCTRCRDACPVPDAVLYNDAVQEIERRVGAVVVATGAGLYDCHRIPELGYGAVPGVYTSLEFERILASNGPTGGELRQPDGSAPQSVAIVHCVGSLDSQHRPYCSGICCEYAFKFTHLIGKKLPDAKVHHFYRDLTTPGKDNFQLCGHARHNPNATLVRYGGPGAVRIAERNGKAVVGFEDGQGKSGEVTVDMVVLCPAMTGAADAGTLSGILDTPLDAFGFFEELHGRLDSAQSKIKGIYIAGTCQAPMNVQGAISQGLAAASYVLSGLVEGRTLEVDPATAAVEEQRCSMCRTCESVCPYKAISYPEERKAAYVNALLCHGCGTCVAACPAGAMQGNHFTDSQILAELEAVLQ